MQRSVICGCLTFGIALAAAAPALAANVTWFMGGIFGSPLAGGLPQCSGCEVTLPPSGDGNIGTLNNNSNLQLSPGVAIVASDLHVHVDVAPTGGAKRIFFLFARATPSKSLKCEIPAGSQTCSSGKQTLAIPAASPIIVDAANLGNAPATSAQFSWKATTP